MDGKDVETKQVKKELTKGENGERIWKREEGKGGVKRTCIRQYSK